MTDPAEIMSDMSDVSDAVEEERRFRSDAPPEASDMSDGEAVPTARDPTRPTAVHECRTEKAKGNQRGPTCPTRPTRDGADWAALVVLFSKPAGEESGRGGALETSEAADEPNAALAFPTVADRLDAYEERAAIAEFDGGLTRKEAERLAAWEICRGRWREGMVAPSEREERRADGDAGERVDTEKDPAVGRRSGPRR